MNAESWKIGKTKNPNRKNETKCVGRSDCVENSCTQSDNRIKYCIEKTTKYTLVPLKIAQ